MYRTISHHKMALFDKIKNFEWFPNEVSDPRQIA